MCGFVYPMEYHWALKKNKGESLPFVTTWMDSCGDCDKWNKSDGER